MAVARILTVLLLLIAAVLVWVWLTPWSPEAAGHPHPRFETMMRGGDLAARRLDLLVAGGLFGGLSICFFVGLLALGLRRRGRLAASPRALLVGLALYLAVFVALLASYRTYVGAPEPRIVLGFPAPTAWMLYGIWLVPLWFLVLYVVRFDRWVMTTDDLRDFHALVERHRESGSPTATASAEER